MSVFLSSAAPVHLAQTFAEVEHPVFEALTFPRAGRNTSARDLVEPVAHPPAVPACRIPHGSRPAIRGENLFCWRKQDLGARKSHAGAGVPSHRAISSGLQILPTTTGTLDAFRATCGYEMARLRLGAIHSCYGQPPRWKQVRVKRATSRVRFGSELHAPCRDASSSSPDC
jgi:hypothetical protein